MIHTAFRPAAGDDGGPSAGSCGRSSSVASIGWGLVVKDVREAVPQVALCI